MQTVTQTKTLSMGWLAAWALGSGIGLTIGLMGSLMLIWSFGENAQATLPASLQPLIGGAVFGLGLGLAVGLAQWLVLRARGVNDLRWFLSSIIGGVVGTIVVSGILFGLNGSGENPVLLIGAFALLGGVLGGTQFLMVREITGSAAWIVASALGLGISAAIVFGAPNADINPIIGAVGGLVYGIVTAAALWWSAKR